MQVFANLWGGEGYLTSKSLLTMASVGMFNDVRDGSNNLMDIYYRCLDTNPESPDGKQAEKMKTSYNNYFNMVFAGETNCLINDNTTDNFFSGKRTFLNDKYPDSEYLALGFSEDEMKLSIKNGIYGKPWIGEAYYADTDFSSLYGSASGDIIVINGGGYKGGGTAATFIYLENRYDIAGVNPGVSGCRRFDTIVGPSTQFDKYVKLPHPELYNEASLKDKINIFDADKIIEKLRSKNMDSADEGHHNENINFLSKQWDDIKDPNHDYTNLNPNKYMAKFIDRINSDVTLTKVVPFINMKYPLIPDGDSYNYDITSDKFAPDNQEHRLHITNLLSALTIQEIALNHSSNEYVNGHIYTFCIPNSNKYTIDGVFRPEDAKKLYRFLAFSTVIIKYIYNCFYDIKKPGASILLTKWALSRRPRLIGLSVGNPAVVLDERKPEGKCNIAFAGYVKDYLAKFVYDYIIPVFTALKDIDDTSEQVEFFGKSQIPQSEFADGLYGIVNDLIQSVTVDQNTKINIRAIESPKEINDSTEKILAAIITGRQGKPSDFLASCKLIKGENGGTNFLEKFQQGIQEFGSYNDKKERTWNDSLNENNVQPEAETYCRNLITYTYSLIKQNLL
ncbi:MAG: hypothetical protein IJM19_00260 [Ruminococcus sp.]|nr:hypothetical protein [Ruminococcus sp.]